ncbi:FAD-binding oxidoreductase [Aeromicrobium alkaliterrae]|uniref:FAD-linked oxidase C-terminal domain-containing protein n=1 Tax=Aeromicrobium alkaliterrae TaxID=302168 RepID=A0ABN2K4K3_9ACTN
MSRDAFLLELAQRAPVLTDATAREAAATDRSGLLPPTSPFAVVAATAVDHVVATLHLAHEHRVAVVTRGAGTGLAGGAVADDGAIVLDVSRLQHLEIDVANHRAVSGPGVLTAHLDAEARKHGLFYAPDPASAAISTIGGNVATNAGGFRCVSYGVTRDAVLGLTTVLPGGAVVQTGAGTVKDVVGYDLTSLLVGSEGTLGVVVEATLRLLPTPTAVATASALLDDAAAAVAAVAELGATGIRPAVCELVDGPTLAAIDDLRGSDWSARGGALLLVQTHGSGAAADIDVVTEVLRRHAVSVATTTDEREAEQLFAARRDALPALEKRGRVLIEDIAVPRDRVAEAVDRIGAIAAEHTVPIFVLAHAGDGNLHPIVLTDAGPRDPLPPAVVTAADAVFGLALELGGSVSGEHGVGLLKGEWARRQLGPEATALAERIRSVFDPHGILNPGKLL